MNVRRLIAISRHHAAHMRRRRASIRAVWGLRSSWKKFAITSESRGFARDAVEMAARHECLDTKVMRWYEPYNRKRSRSSRLRRTASRRGAGLRVDRLEGGRMVRLLSG